MANNKKNRETFFGGYVGHSLQTNYERNFSEFKEYFRIGRVHRRSVDYKF